MMNTYIPAYNIDLLPVLIALISLSTVMLWIAIKNYKNLFAMMIIIPLTIFSGWTVYTTIDKLLGYPVVESFTEESIYISHVESLDGDWLFVWIFKPVDTRPKAIMVPNSENNKETMEEAKARSEGGIPQVIKSKKDNNGQTNGGEIERYDFQMQDNRNLKDIEPQNGRSENSDLIRNPSKPIQPSNSRPGQGLDFSIPSTNSSIFVEELKRHIIIPSGK